MVKESSLMSSKPTRDSLPESIRATFRILWQFIGIVKGDLTRVRADLECITNPRLVIDEIGFFPITDEPCLRSVGICSCSKVIRVFDIAPSGLELEWADKAPWQTNFDCTVAGCGYEIDRLVVDT
jgi:hypothetical protein